MQENQEKFMQLVNEKNADKNLKYAILTMGCQLNENDSEKIAGMLEEMGYKTDVLEFIDMEHTPKNILIRAVKDKKAGRNLGLY